MNSFQCITLSPAGGEYPGIAIATLRAGGIGILDLEFCRDFLQAEKNLASVIAESTFFPGGVGLRLHTRQIASAKGLLKALRHNNHYLLICGVEPQSFTRELRKLPKKKCSLLVEVRDAGDVKVLQDAEIAGFVAKGNESGGWVSEDCAFILAQKMLSLSNHPVYVQGGMGIHSAAACRAVGAAGVVLEEQLLFMPESSFPMEWRHFLENADGTEAVVIDETLGNPCRVFSRPGSEIAKILPHYSDKVPMADHSKASLMKWRDRIHEHLGWNGPDQAAWPIGQAVGLAKEYRDRYKTTGRLIHALMKHTAECIARLKSDNPLKPNSPLAQCHGTEYPIVQGPMARVSDVPEFAEAVSTAGALPFLALSYMSGEKIVELLKVTKRLLGDRPWGVGLLGFLPQQLWEEQIMAVLEMPPPFALIAGGQPHQVARLESHGIPTYIHAPSPALLHFFLEKGLRRFVFEGRECGGHIGPLSSFMLWEHIVGILLEKWRGGKADNVDLLFAGGIHDARSAAMVSAMALPLTERGMRVGVVMGSSYLFTEEASSTGAITKPFQQQALECKRTINLQSGAGHAIRSAMTPFAFEFIEKKRDLISSGLPANEVRETLERLCAGRLRVASKGILRDGQGNFKKLDSDTQLTEGLFMMGQVATLRSEVVSSREMHREICEGSTKLLSAISSVEEHGDSPAWSKAQDIAIIGIGTLLPKAQDPETYWHNIVHKISAISEIPADRWDWRLYYDPDPRAKDKICSKWGAFLDEIHFDPVRYGIPPNSLKSIDPLQLLALEVVRQAIDDAGYASGGYDKENTSVVLGAGSIGEGGIRYALRAEIPRFVDAPSEACFERLPEWTEESFPGYLLNVTAGRVANRFDFGGLNFTVDAACASSLAAIYVAVNELESRRSNLVIAGGADTGQGPFSFMSFSKTQALSPRGKVSTFDQSGDGIVIGEGLAAVVLKRLEDAERDGDRIYAVIKGIAGSSDGKARGLTAPLPEGQMRALQRAYRKAGVPPSSVGLIEAHGTGTSAGDRAEAETVIQTLRASQTPPKACALGSVKPLIGHTKSTAGVAGLIKVALALKHKVLPPHPGAERPLDDISDPESPVHLVKEPLPWLRDPFRPRRGAVSAFGFGGTNFHAILEEYTRDNNPSASPLGESRWPHELFVFGAPSRAAMISELTALRKALMQGAKPGLRDLAYTCARESEEKQDTSFRVSFVAGGLQEVSGILEKVIEALDGDGQKHLPEHVRMKDNRNVDRGHTAFVFPGQGSQHTHMCREISLYFSEMRESLESFDREFRDCFPKRLSSYIFPPSEYTEDEKEKNMHALADTHIAQPALATIEAGFVSLFRRLQILPDMAAGHSFGEYVALHAAGVLSREDLFRLAEIRGSILKKAGSGRRRGAMAAVKAERERISDFLKDFPHVVVANHNAPLQSVISGPEQDVRKAAEKLREGDIPVRVLPVSGAFHSPLMRSAQASLTEALSTTRFNAPALRVFSNSSGTLYPKEAKTIRKLLSDHLVRPVEFASEIQNMYEAGARVYIEMGPGRVLSNLIREILEGKQCTVIPLDGYVDGLQGFLSALGTIFSEGIGSKISLLFGGRDVSKVDLKKLIATKPGELSGTSCYVSGGAVRYRNEGEGLSGGRPQLNRDTAEKANRTRTENAARASGDDQVLLAYQETMREFLRLQERVMHEFLTGQTSPGEAPPAWEGQSGSMQDLPSGIPAPVKAAQPDSTCVLKRREKDPEPVRATPSRVQETSSEGGDWNRQRITEVVIDIVSARTGYPPEMLGLEQDVEAELGIDSIKRVEILSMLQKRLPPTLAEILQRKMEVFTQLKALSAIVDELVKLIPADSHSLTGNNVTTHPSGAPEGIPSPCANSIDRPVPRFIMEAKKEPRQEGGFITPSGLYLITRDASLVAPLVAESLNGKGARAEILERDLLYDVTKLEERIAELKSRFGPVAGIVHLTALQESSMPSTLSEWRRYTQVNIKGFFQLIRLCARDLSAAGSSGNGRVLFASMSGGLFGRNERETRSVPAVRAGVGLLNSLGLEWPGIRAKSVDVDGSTSPAGLSRSITEELLTDGGCREIGYPAGVRTAFYTVPAPLNTASDNAPLPLSFDAVILATGGARGITAEVVNKLTVKGMTVILVGRSPEPAAEAEETAGIRDKETLRRILITRASGRGRTVTPSLVEQELTGLMRDREIRANISRLKDKGVNVEYHAADVRSEEEFGTVIDDIYTRYGRLDAVLHGAGIVEDKLLIDKTEESFDRVFDTKVDSSFILWRHVRPDSLRYFILFSSVAGRYGNIGQADYAAANEALNQLAWHLHGAWENARVIAFNWGPWEEVGMASDATINAFLASRGITALPVRSGLEFFVNELLYGSRSDVEIIAGAGPWGTGDDGL